MRESSIGRIKDSAIISRKGQGLIVLHNFSVKQPVIINVNASKLSPKKIIDKHPKYLINANSLKTILNPIIHLKDEKVAHKRKNSSTYIRSTLKKEETPKKANKIILKQKPNRNFLQTDRKPQDNLLLPSKQLLNHNVSDFETSELLAYNLIYYMGNGLAMYNYEKRKSFDDDNDDYNSYVGEHIGYRYEILDMLGKGSFGQVLKCLDHRTNTIVAVKIIQSKKRLYKQGNIEIKILKYIRDRGININVVKILNSFMFRGHIVMLFIKHSVLYLSYLILTFILI